MTFVLSIAYSVAIGKVERAHARFKLSNSGSTMLVAEQHLLTRPLLPRNVYHDVMNHFALSFKSTMMSIQRENLRER